MPNTTANARIASLLRAASLEVYSRNAPEKIDGALPPDADIYVSYLPGDDMMKRVEIAAALRAAGYNPVLHVPARQMQSRAQLDEFLAAAQSAARVDRVLLIAGDSTRPRGPFADSLQVMESGVLRARGIRHVDVAGHPEGNAGLDSAQLIQVLIAKRDAARADGLAFGVVTQFCFDPHPIVAWLEATRAAGIDASIRIGLAGPANPATLLKFALRCGVGNSLSALQNHVGTIGRLLRDTGPEGVVRGLADTLAGEAGARVAGFHFFPFGGVDKTAAWISRALAEAEGR